MTDETWSRAYLLRLGLGSVPASGEEVLAEFDHKIDHYRPAISETTTGLELSVTVVASDLWLAVLEAMNAVVGTGYSIQHLEAHPVTPSIRRPPPMRDPD